MGKHSDEIKMDVRMWKGLGILKRKPKAIMLVFMLACTYIVWNTLVELK